MPTSSYQDLNTEVEKLREAVSVLERQRVERWEAAEQARPSASSRRGVPRRGSGSSTTPASKRQGRRSVDGRPATTGRPPRAAGGRTPSYHSSSRGGEGSHFRGPSYRSDDGAGSSEEEQEDDEAEQALQQQQQQQRHVARPEESDRYYDEHYDDRRGEMLFGGAPGEGESGSSLFTGAAGGEPAVPTVGVDSFGVLAASYDDRRHREPAGGGGVGAMPAVAQSTPSGGLFDKQGLGARGRREGASFGGYSEGQSSYSMGSNGGAEVGAGPGYDPARYSPSPSDGYPSQAAAWSSGVTAGVPSSRPPLVTSVQTVATGVAVSQAAATVPTVSVAAPVASGGAAGGSGSAVAAYGTPGGGGGGGGGGGPDEPATMGEPALVSTRTMDGGKVRAEGRVPLRMLSQLQCLCACACTQQTERQYSDGSAVITYRNGTTREVSPAGDVTVKFHNGDIRTVCSVAPLGRLGGWLAHCVSCAMPVAADICRRWQGGVLLCRSSDDTHSHERWHSVV